MYVNAGHLLVFFNCVFLTVGTKPTKPLPAFKVETRQISSDDCLNYARTLFGDDDYRISTSSGRLVVRDCDGLKRVECDTISGGILASDNSEPADPTAGPTKEVPGKEEAEALAMALFKKLDLLPKNTEYIELKSEGSSNTIVAHEYDVGYGNYIREEWPLDIVVTLKVVIKYGHEVYELAGGGGKFTATFGNCGKLISLQTVWREIVGKEEYDLPTQEQANQEYLEGLGAIAQNTTFSSQTAYYSSPFGVQQKQMNPGYLFTADSVINGQPVQIRPGVSRGMKPTGSGVRGRSIRGRGIPKEDDKPVTPPAGSEDGKYEAATEWMGEPYGLGLAGENAAGFKAMVMSSAPIGRFSYEKSNDAVWESDFTANDDEFVDSVDLLFYTGHANKDGWMVADPATGAPEIVQYTSWGSNHLGSSDLEWLVVAACGPHQDELFEPGAGDVFGRWRGIFADGLHIMLGYATESADASEEGAKFMKYAQEGYSLIDAWFRTAKDLQPPGVIVSAMWVDDARYDHLPGYGSVSQDRSEGPQDRWVMWTRI